MNLPIRDPRPEKPGELSVQTPAKYGLVINLKAANVIKRRSNWPLSGAGADQLRAGNQSQNREDTGPYRSAVATRLRQ